MSEDQLLFLLLFHTLVMTFMLLTLKFVEVYGDYDDDDDDDYVDYEDEDEGEDCDDHRDRVFYDVDKY